MDMFFLKTEAFPMGNGPPPSLPQSPSLNKAVPCSAGLEGAFSIIASKKSGSPTKSKIRKSLLEGFHTSKLLKH